MRRQLDTFTAPLPDGGTETRQSSRDLVSAVVVAMTAADRAVQLEESISRHRAEAAADLRNDGMRHDSRKEARRAAGIRDAETVLDVERLAELRALPPETLVNASVWGWYVDEAAAVRGLRAAGSLYSVSRIVGITRDTPGRKVGVVFPTEIAETCPNAADEPGGTDQGDNMNNVNLTAKETALLTAIADNYFSFFDGGLVAGSDSGIWAECMTGEIAGSTEYAVSATQRGAASVMNSVARKGLLEVSTNEDGAWVMLTDAGVAWIEAHNAPAAVEAEVEVETIVPAELPAVLVLSGETVEVETESLAAQAAEAAELPIVTPAVAEVVETEAPVKWGMGTHTVGDVVKSKDGVEWTVAGPAEKGKTVRLERTVDGVVKVRLSFHYNITKA